MAVQISGNDITVPRDGTFSRNVSIAGTLTYEDVTNIDSVGLITAREGIEVGASPGVAASISVDGNMIVSGITTIGGDIKVGSGVTIGKDGHLFATGVTTSTTVKVGAAVTISESGIEASGIGITCANINGAQIGGRRNIIINGAMLVAQRGTSATAASGYTTLDRFSQSATNLANNCDVIQEDLTSGDAYDNGFRKSYKVTNGDNNADSNDQSKINHIIEAQDLANSGWSHKDPNSFITLSFWVKSSVAQTFSVAIYADDANMGYGFEYSATTSWTKITHSIPGHASLGINNDNGSGFNIQWYLYMGTGLTSSGFTNADWHTYNSSSRSKDMTTTWQTTNDATFEITGVQLEVGSQATPFEHRSFGEEERLCQRYFFKWSSSQAYSNFNMCYATSATNVDPVYQLPVVMRDSPTLATSGTFRIVGYSYNAGQDSSSLSSIQITRSHTRSPYIRATSSGMGVGQIGEFGDNGSNDATMSFSAEL